MKSFGASDILEKHAWIVRLLVILTFLTAILYVVVRRPGIDWAHLTEYMNLWNRQGLLELAYFWQTSPPTAVQVPDHLIYDRKDLPFVLLILINTVLTYMGLELIHRSMSDTRLELWTAEMRRVVFSTRYMLLVGITWGFIISFAAFAVWKSGFVIYRSSADLFGEREIRALCLFLFFHNILIGMGLYSLLRYQISIYELAHNIEINLWDRSSPSVDRLIETTRRVTGFAALVAAIAVISVTPLLSSFKFDLVIALFSLFSLVVILSAFIVPLIPINQKMLNVKRQHLDEVGRLMAAEYQVQIEKFTSGCSDYDMQRYDMLAALHDKIQSISTIFFPWNLQILKVLVTGMWVVFLALLPLLLTLFVDWLTPPT